MNQRSEYDELKMMINSFRLAELTSLMKAFGLPFQGRKTDLSNKALEILMAGHPQINAEDYKGKVRQLSVTLQDESKRAPMTGRMSGQVQQMQMQQGRTQLASMLPQQQIRHSNQMQQAQRYSSINYNMHQGGQVQQPHPRMNSYQLMQQQQQQQQQSAYQTPVVVPQHYCNITDNILVITPTVNYQPRFTFTLLPLVKFRKLAFFRTMYEIMKPTLLTMNTQCVTLQPNVKSTEQLQEFHFAFVLNHKMASDLSMNRDITLTTSNGKPSDDYDVQLQMRMCTYDCSDSTPIEYDDFLPLGLTVRVNGKGNMLPPCVPTTRTGVDPRRLAKPINLTQHLRMSPLNANNVIINWVREIDKPMALTINIVEKLTSETLIQRLKERKMIPIEETKKIIRQQFRGIDEDEGDSGDDDIAATNVRVSLQCPLVKYRISLPVRGPNCTHLQCFDGCSFICLNEKKANWVCPVCHKTVYYDDILVDEYFHNVLTSDQLLPDCQEVQLFIDGTWKSFDENAPAVQPTITKSEPIEEAQKPESSLCSELENVSVSETKPQNNDDAVSIASDGNNENDGGGATIDLTEEDEEDVVKKSDEVDSTVEMAEPSSFNAPEEIRKTSGEAETTTKASVLPENISSDEIAVPAPADTSTSTSEGVILLDSPVDSPVED